MLTQQRLSIDRTRRFVLEADDGAEGGDARRLLLSRLVIEYRLAPQDPLSLGGQAWEEEAINLLLDDAPVPLAKAVTLLAA